MSCSSFQEDEFDVVAYLVEHFFSEPDGDGEEAETVPEASHGRKRALDGGENGKSIGKKGKKTL